MNLIPGKSTDLSFGLPNRQGGITPLSKHDIDGMLRSLFEKCSIDIYHHFSFHSLRRGGATLAAAMDAPEIEICAIRHWV